LIKIAESFTSPGDEKITKGLAHCEERPGPDVITDEKCAIFSNSVVLLLSEFLLCVVYHKQKKSTAQ
jgi:hypothetical protein